MIRRHDSAGTDWKAIALIVAIALAASIAGIANDFVSDDIHLIATNAGIQDLQNWRLWFTLPFWPPPFSPDLYRPLTSFCLALQYALGGGSPVVFRVVSYLLYAASAVSVFALSKRVMTRPAAIAAAVLFAAHPVHVEAVALGVGQSELLVAIVALTMCVVYLDRRRANQLDWRAWAILAALYLAACLIKEQGFVLPALLGMTELCFVSGPWRQRVRELRLGYAMLAGIALLVLLVRQQVLGAFGGSFTAEALIGIGPGGRMLTMLAIVPQWVRLFLWPVHLRGDYSPQEFVASTGLGGAETVGLLLILAAALLAWRAPRHPSTIAFGIGWCAIALFPVSNVIPTGILIAERTLFLPSIGVVIALAGVAEWLLRAQAPATLRRVPMAACGVVVSLVVSLVVALGIARSAERQRVWRNEGFFVGRGIRDVPRSFRMQQAYGDLLFAVDQPALAATAYARAIQYSTPSVVWRVRNDLARRLRERGETSAEVEQLRASLAQRPDQELTRGDLIVAYLLLGRYAEAHAQADSAIAHGSNAMVFGRVSVVADSAMRAHAPVGSVRMSVNRGAVTASR